jgi:CheY-like chemotaxis protein/DNA-binding Xre family transcriptional regulator
VSKRQKVPRTADSTIQSQFGAAIRAQRLRLGVTQEELAWRADMHRTYLAGIERGARNITLRSIANLARALEVSVGDLLARTAERTRALPPGEILLVEDNVEDAELTLRAFRRAGLANPVQVVGTGRAALDHVLGKGRPRRRRNLPHLVLLDINLPDISGVDVLRELKAGTETRHIPVVMLTISRDDQHVIECGRLGAANYIVKPVEFGSLARVTPHLDLQWTLVKPSLPGKPLPT